MGRFGRCMGALAWLAAALVGPARAADLPAPSYYPPAAPLPPAVYDWAGFYIGGNIGAGLLSDAWTQNTAAPAAPADPIAGTIYAGPLGVIGGGQAGLNFQFRSWVVGIEALWDDSAITGNGTVDTTPPSVVRGTSAPMWLASATGRVGYASDAWLFYAKGGGAWMSVKYTEDVLGAFGFNTGTQGISDTRAGFTAGVGLEFGMTESLSARVEYDFFGFGSKAYNFTLITPVNIRSDLNTFTAGINYRFNWAAGWH